MRCRQLRDRKIYSSLWQRCWLGALLFSLGLLLVLGLQRLGSAQAIPEWRTYPLPDSLARIAPAVHHDDYADQLNPTPVGSLLWSRFPITVAIDLADSRAPRQAVWLRSVRQAISDWNQYLPLIEIADNAAADILFRRASVPIRRGPDGQLQRIRLAETRFSFFVDTTRRLRHRMQIYLSPNQADISLLAGARHELGHALGIWGHSDRATDVMYFAQVHQPRGISERDIQTLRRVYSMPTRLGGKVIESVQSD